ncbi:hypothetical protein JEQ12_019772 [Ovis aries]|uniref:MAGE domain-containing protein n=1 Tax=Ovis aries TaxID=9940 RepID=A0A835ZII4_SHEEP|nr:hypothetical protein JEQ12_019772 [Ovis aries]
MRRTGSDVLLSTLGETPSLTVPLSLRAAIDGGQREQSQVSSGVKIGRDGSPLSSPAAGDRQELQGAMAPSSPDAGPSCAGSDEGAQGPEEESAGASQAAPATQSTRKDPLARKARILVGFLLEKYTKKEPITQKALMKIVSRKYRQHFPEILSTARECVELVFGLEMKEVDRSRNIYTLISKLNLGGNDCLSGEGGLPKSGLLMVLLGVIFMNGNRATEEEIWEFLKEYLNYRQVPNSDPPHYEFLWGPRACAETSKMKAAKALATGQLIQPVERVDSDMLPEVKNFLCAEEHSLRKYKEHFPEILSRASERVELVFGLELKEVDCSRNIYALVNKFTLGVEEGSSDEEELPKSGLLMALLGIIFMKGNRATEEEVWDFLSVLGIYAGRKHCIFGEPRKLITKDLVQKGVPQLPPGAQ